MEPSHTNHKPPNRNQSQIIWIALTALSVAAIVIVIVGFIWGIGKILNLLSPVLWPLAIAAVLAYLLDPPVNWLQRHKFSRTWAIMTAFIGVFCVVAGILASVVPQLVDETNKLVENLPNYTAQARQKVENWADKADKAAATLEQQSTNSIAGTNAVAATNHSPDSSNSNNAKINSPRQSTAPVASNLQSNSQTNHSPTNSAPADNQQIHKQLVSSARSWVTQVMPKIGNWLFNLIGKAPSLVDAIVGAVLIPIYAFYFLREKREIKTHWHNYLPIRNSRTKDEIVFILSAINQYMIAFFRGQVLVALISGALYTVGYLALGLDYAFLLGVTAVILIIIPFVGAIINGIIALILTAVQFHDLFHPLMIVVIFAIVQSLESFFYSPRIMGNRVNLHPVVVIIALMIGMTLLGGLLGGILAIPLAAALRVLLFRYVWKKPQPS